MAISLPGGRPDLHPFSFVLFEFVSKGISLIYNENINIFKKKIRLSVCKGFQESFPLTSQCEGPLFLL